MRTTLGTLTIAWAAVYGYVCFYYVALWLRRRSEREYLAFALMSGGLSIAAVGGSLLHEAATLDQGLHALTIKTIGLTIATAFLVSFVQALTGRGGRRLIIPAFAWMVATLGTLLSGHFFLPTTPAARPTWGFAFAPDFPEPALGPLGAILTIAAWLIVGLALSPRDDRDDRDDRVDRDPQARLVLFATGANLAAMAQDIFVHVGSLRSFYLVEHSALLAVLAMSRLLIARFQRSRDALEVRERELSRSYDELRETEEALVRKEQLAAVGAFSGVIATEVRAPLEAIRDATHGLERDGDSDERNAVLVEVDAQVERLNRLVNDVLTYARPVTLEGQAVDVKALVDAALARIASRAGRASVTVQTETSGARSVIHGDPGLLRRAIDSLVDSALSAMPEGGQLTIRLEATELSGEPAVALAFVDTGETETLALGSRAISPLVATPLKGLGLAIVERVIHVHRGRLAIDAQQGVGTTVTLTLPVGRSSARPDSGGNAA